MGLMDHSLSRALLVQLEGNFRFLSWIFLKAEKIVCYLEIVLISQVHQHYTVIKIMVLYDFFVI